MGPTATGKSDLAVRLAKKFGGEVISADSRQVYKGLNIGTGKISKKEMAGVPHHMLDVANPKKQFSVAQYAVLAKKVMGNILKQGRLPIICGGSGFYIQALVDNIILPDVKPNARLRKLLQKKSAEKLLHMLTRLAPKRASKIDPYNKRRLIRAIEIAKALGKVPHLEASPPSGEILKIGLDLPTVELKERIEKRLHARLRKGMLKEAIRLHEKGLSWKRMEELGLEYRYMALHLQGNISKEEMIRELQRKIWQYVRRQRTWFKKDKRIKWFRPNDKKI